MVREELNLVSEFYLPYFYYYQIITLASLKFPIGIILILRHQPTSILTFKVTLTLILTSKKLAKKVFGVLKRPYQVM